MLAVIFVSPKSFFFYEGKWNLQQKNSFPEEELLVATETHCSSEEYNILNKFIDWKDSMLRQTEIYPILLLWNMRQIPLL